MLQCVLIYLIQQISSCSTSDSSPKSKLPWLSILRHHDSIRYISDIRYLWSKEKFTLAHSSGGEVHNSAIPLTWVSDKGGASGWEQMFRRRSDRDKDREWFVWPFKGTPLMTWGMSHKAPLQQGPQHRLLVPSWGGTKLYIGNFGRHMSKPYHLKRLSCVADFFSNNDSHTK